ncbi:ParB/RepB/Spo0J family partition protein [Priestia aryabhattai]
MSNKVDSQTKLNLEENNPSETDSINRQNNSNEYIVDERKVVNVEISKVFPNPLNPRKNDKIRTEELQEILDKRGWEEPLTGYKAGSRYILLGGHRRLRAAKGHNEKPENANKQITHIPIYVVDRPLDEQEELERIASLQGARVNWSPFDWGKYVYDKWVKWGKPPINRFVKKIDGVSTTLAKQYINVFDYFPIKEIQGELEKNSLNMSALDAMVNWMGHLKNLHPQVVQDLGESFIRKHMLDKIIDKKITRDILRNKEFLKQATDDDVMDFLSDPDKSLEEHMEYLGISKKSTDFNGRLISLGHTKKSLAEDFNPTTESERVNGIARLKEVLEQGEATLRKLEALKGTFDSNENKKKETQSVK